jgi:peptidyl-prolyl cis-trans isomerase A (cyclophilin A)
VRVLAVHRERQLVGDRLADEMRAGIEQALHGRRRGGLDPRHRQHEGLAAAGRVAGDVEQVLDGERQPRERPRRGVRDRRIGIRHEGAGGIAKHRHGAKVALSFAPMRRRHVLALAALMLAAGRTRAAPGVVRTIVETDAGAFVVAVDAEVAPLTVANYLAHVDRMLLDGGAVYRVVTLANQAAETRHKIEVVQWGMNRPDDAPPPLPPIAHETTRQTGLRHLDGTVSMARAQPGSATGEFFVCIGDQPELDFGGGRHPDGQGFAAFGRVVAGMDVVRAIHARGEADQYLARPIVVRSVRRLAA